MSDKEREYSTDQWWFKELEGVWGNPDIPLNTRRAALMAVKFIRAALDATPAEPSAVELTDEKIITIWDAWPSDIETGESALAFVHAVLAAAKGKA